MQNIYLLLTRFALPPPDPLLRFFDDVFLSSALVVAILVASATGDVTVGAEAPARTGVVVPDCKGVEEDESFFCVFHKFVTDLFIEFVCCIIGFFGNNDDDVEYDGELDKIRLLGKHSAIHVGCAEDELLLLLTKAYPAS